MNNYVTYPRRQFVKNSCIIVFGDRKYSWCFLTESQKSYLTTSGYLDRAKRLDVRTVSGTAYSMTPDQFKEWVESGDTEPDSSLEMTGEEPTGDQFCPLCGKSLVVRTAKVGPSKGNRFWGCTGFPECRFTKPLTEKAGVKCPVCGGEILIKKTKKGRRYYGCENNPSCEYMSWRKPSEESSGQ